MVFQSARYPAGNHALDVWVDCMGSARGWHACAALPSREACRTNPMHSVDLSNNLRPCICTMDLHKLHMASLKSRKGLPGCIKICTQSVGREATRSTELCLSLSRCVPNVDTLIADMPRQRLCKTMRVMETHPQLLGMMTAVKEQCVMLIRIEKTFRVEETSRKLSGADCKYCLQAGPP